MCEHVRAHYFASVGVFLYTCHTHDNRHTVVTGDEGQLREGGASWEANSNIIEIEKDYRDLTR